MPGGAQPLIANKQQPLCHHFQWGLQRVRGRFGDSFVKLDFNLLCKIVYPQDQQALMESVMVPWGAPAAPRCSSDLPNAAGKASCDSGGKNGSGRPAAVCDQSRCDGHLKAQAAPR